MTTDELKAAAERVDDSLRMAEEGVVEKEALDITYDGDMDGFKRDMKTLADGILQRLDADEQREQERLVWAPQFRAEWLERIGQTECERPVGSIEDEAKLLLFALLDQELRRAWQGKLESERVATLERERDDLKMLRDHWVAFAKTLEAERVKAQVLVAEVLACGVEYSPPLGSYVVVQIPKELLRKIEDMKGGDA